MRRVWCNWATTAPIVPEASSDQRFDRWPGRRLHEAHGDILRESLPDELLRLLQAFENAEQSRRIERRIAYVDN
jgi:hypothetical protein